MKKYTLRAASERAVMEALTFYIEQHRHTLTQNKMRPYLIARKEIRRQTITKSQTKLRRRRSNNNIPL